MTRDEIVNMPAGREMDMLIIEKVRGGKYPYILGFDENDNPIPPLFSTDISAAWEVIETFNGVEWDVSIARDTEDEGKVWGVSLTKWSDQPIGHIAYGGGEDASLPLAICRAALLAIQEMNEI